MPFTPLHMGPGATVKLIGQRRFSLLIFGLTQVLIDLEPLIRMYRGDTVLHGPSHTYLGALVNGTLAMLIGKPLFQYLSHDWNETRKPWPLYRLKLSERISWTAAASGAYIGTISHIVLDSFMHADIHPWAPVYDANGLYLLIPIGWVNLLCLTAGMFAVMGYVGLLLWRHFFIEIP